MTFLFLFRMMTPMPATWMPSSPLAPRDFLILFEGLLFDM